MNLFGWLRRSPPAVLPLPPKKTRSSLFSTEMWDMDDVDWKTILQKSFQRLPSDLRPVNSAGEAVTNYTVSTAAPGVAMDAASAGNVLSMKPIIPTFDTIPQAQLAWYAGQGFIGYQICAMVAQQWLVEKACTMPARDAMRHWYELGSDTEVVIDLKVMSAIRKLDKKMKIKKKCVEFLKFNRVFGIRVALPIVDTKDPNYYLEPFDIKKVKPGSYRGITQIDPYWITPELDAAAAANPASLHFYEPTWWRVNGIRIHRSHLIIITNGEVADVLKPTYYYGGVSVPQKIAERVYAAERTANEAPQLALTKRTTWMKVDVTQAIADFTSFIQKLGFFAEMRDNYGVKIGGLDDEMQQFDTSLTDYDTVTMLEYRLVAGASDVPAAKLLSESPKGGMGSEGDYDTDSYHEFLESCEEDVEPLIDRHYELLMASEIIPVFPKVPTDWVPTITWNSTETIGAKQRADINEIKSRTGNNLTNGGAIDGVDERDRLKGDKDSGYTNLGDREPEMQEDDDVESDKPEPDESE